MRFLWMSVPGDNSSSICSCSLGIFAFALKLYDVFEMIDNYVVLCHFMVKVLCTEVI